MKGLINIAILMFCSVVANYAWAEQPPEISQILAETHAYIKKDLKDPDSAKFREEYVLKSHGKDGAVVYGVCGEINAKNSYGGYIGFTPYFYQLSTTKFGKIRKINDDAAFDIVYPVFCNKAEEGAEVFHIPNKN